MPVYVFLSQIMHSETSAWYMNILACAFSFNLLYDRTDDSDSALSFSAVMHLLLQSKKNGMEFGKEWTYLTKI